MTDTPIEWREPPSNMTPRTDWVGLLTALRERPGQWALIKQMQTTRGATVAASNIRAGKLGGAAPEEFEVRVDGMDIYARYDGA